MVTTKLVTMNRLIMLAFSCLLLVSQLSAEPITAQQAEQKARQFLSAKKGQVQLSTVPYGGAASSRALTGTSTPLLYVYNIGQDEGFVILAGDDAAPAVLGYADKGSYCYEELPANARVWIDGYADQIASLAGSTSVGSAATAVELHDAIEPLLKSFWNQERPFNNLCPTFINGSPTVTGCVATAMAQVLYYYKEETVRTLQAEIPSYQCRTSWVGYGSVAVKGFPAGSIIDWDNMIDRYTSSATEEQQKAVAELMAYCGASVEMEYCDKLNGGSSANEMGVPEALKKYFGFSSEATVKYRADFTPENWDRLVYRELMNKRPVIMSGEDTKGNGHAFICDGYNAEGYYHFNWGWGGQADGYYLMTNLLPTTQGAGGSGGAYNNNLGAVVGMRPGNGKPHEELLRLTVTDFSKPATGEQAFVKGENTLFEYAYSIQNRTTSTRAFDYALALYKDGEFLKLMVNPTSGYINKITTKSPFGKFGGNDVWWRLTFGYGTYQVKPVCKINGTQEWQECEGADLWNVDLTISENGLKYTLHQFVEPEVELGYDPAPDPIATEEQKSVAADSLRMDIQSVHESLASVVDIVGKAKESNKERLSLVADVEKDVAGLIGVLAQPEAEPLRAAYQPRVDVLLDSISSFKRALADVDTRLNNCLVSVDSLNAEASSFEAAQLAAMPKVYTVGDLTAWTNENAKQLTILWLLSAATTGELLDILKRQTAIVNGAMTVDSLCYAVRSALEADIATAVTEVRFVKPVDVYTVSGRKILSGVLSLEGLPAGVYIVGRQKYIVR